jgi:hypothetical protein
MNESFKPGSHEQQKLQKSDPFFCIRQKKIGIFLSFLTDAKKRIRFLLFVWTRLYSPTLTYRKLAGVAGATMERIPNKNPLATLEEEKREHQIKVRPFSRRNPRGFLNIFWGLCLHSSNGTIAFLGVHDKINANSQVIDPDNRLLD